MRLPLNASARVRLKITPQEGSAKGNIHWGFKEFQLDGSGKPQGFGSALRLALSEADGEDAIYRVFKDLFAGGKYRDVEGVGYKMLDRGSHPFKPVLRRLINEGAIAPPPPTEGEGPGRLK